MASVVFYSGGLCSHLAAKRWVAHGHKPILLFSDTGVEDEDLYRFVREGAALLGCELVTVRAPETFDEMCVRKHAIPNDRMPFCSHILKIAPAKEWMKAHPEVDTLVFGLDWTETHRLPKSEKLWSGYRCVAPMMEPPYLMKEMMADQVAADGLEPPRLYKMGFKHNNCGGGCVRNGHASWVHLANVMPERFKEWADREALLGNGYTFSRDRTGGVSRPISLLQLIERDTPEMDFGGCGCFIDEEAETQ